MKDIVHIGLLGFGNVGTGAYRTLQENRESIAQKVGAEVRIKRIAVAHPDRQRDIDLEPGVLTGDPYDILNDPEIDIVCELIGGVQPARTYIQTAFERGKHVVTCNKELLAKHLGEVTQEASARGLFLLFEGAVAGGVPVVGPLTTSLAGNRIDKIVGIVNGTTNFILTKMSRDGQEFDQALSEAQRLGYAEADPSSDVEGWDAAYKMLILAGVGLGVETSIDTVHTEGISGITGRDIVYARDLGYTIKLLGTARRDSDTVEVRVHPTMLPYSHPMARVDDAYNAVMVSGSSVGNVMFYGSGAGPLPTGSAVMGDVVEIARNLAIGAPPTRPRLSLTPLPVAPLSDIVCPFYLRMTVADRPRVLAAVAGVLGDHGVSIHSVAQRDVDENGAEIILITHPARESSIRDAIIEIEDAGIDASIGAVIRVEG
jgi:homoserine dehydrogenase